MENEVELIITVTCQEDDRQWLRDKIVPAVEDVVETQIDEGRVSDETNVSWDFHP
jgi:hypothetical protein